MGRHSRRTVREDRALVDYYAILGIPPTASLDEVKAAYKRLVKQWHPDVCDRPDAHDQFIRITEAYHVLSDPYQRMQYDRAYQQHARPRQQAQQRATGKDVGPSGDAWEDFVRQSAGFRRAAAEQAQKYWNMSLDRVLPALSQAAAQAAGYVWHGQREVRSNWTFQDTLATGFKGLFFIAGVAMLFSGVLAVPGGALTYLTVRSLLSSLSKDGHFIGFGRLVSSVFIVGLMVGAVFLFLIVLAQYP